MSTRVGRRADRASARPAAGPRPPEDPVPPVQGVTTAAPPRSEDRLHRMRVYLIQMAVRTACFIAALFTHGGWQLAFIIGAVILPYIAVVSANNSGPEQTGTLRPPDPVVPERPALAAEPTPGRQPVVLTGEVVDDPGPVVRRALPSAPQRDGRPS